MTRSVPGTPVGSTKMMRTGLCRIKYLRRNLTGKIAPRCHQFLRKLPFSQRFMRISLSGGRDAVDQLGLVANARLNRNKRSSSSSRVANATVSSPGWKETPAGRSVDRTPSRSTILMVAFGHRIGYLPFDVGRVLRLAAVRNRLNERTLSEAELHCILSLEPDPRNRAMLTLLYASGVRVSELCLLAWRDLQPNGEGGQITVFGKGSVTRSIQQPASVWKLVQALRPKDAAVGDPVFRSRKEHGFQQPVAVLRIVRAAAKRASIDLPVCARIGSGMPCFPRARARRAHPPGAGNSRTCQRHDDRTLSARQAAGQLQPLSAAVRAVPHNPAVREMFEDVRPRKDSLSDFPPKTSLIDRREFPKGHPSADWLLLDAPALAGFPFCRDFGALGDAETRANCTPVFPTLYKLSLFVECQRGKGFCDRVSQSRTRSFQGAARGTLQNLPIVQKVARQRFCRRVIEG